MEIFVSFLTQVSESTDCPALFFLHHHSALQMSNKLPAKLFSWPRSEFLSVNSADHSVVDTKLKLARCHDNWQIAETLSRVPWALLPPRQ